MKEFPSFLKIQCDSVSQYEFVSSVHVVRSREVNSACLCRTDRVEVDSEEERERKRKKMKKKEKEKRKRDEKEKEDL